MSADGSTATEDDSKIPALLPAAEPAALAVLALAVLGGVLLCLAELSAVVQIRVGDVVRATESGHAQHGWALLVLGVAALPLAWAAATGRVRPALGALVTIGLVALVFWAVRDLPDTRQTGTFGVRYEDASAGPGPGFWIELAGALALLTAGSIGLLALRPRGTPRGPRGPRAPRPLEPPA
jgi:hypothetical protein